MKKRLLIPLLAAVLFTGCINQKKVVRVEDSGDIGINEGDIIPDFVITKLEGLTLMRKDLENKVVVITASAAWCATCELEAKEFAPVYHQYKDQDVLFISIDIDPRDSDTFIREFMQKTNTHWNYGNARNNNKVIKILELNAFEITYVIDKDGLIVFKDKMITPTDTLRDAIQLAL